MAAFLRLGNKYEIPSLRTEAIVRLTAHFPSTLEEWDKPRTLIQFHPGFVCDVIKLAHDQEVQSILPAAFYSCCVLDVHHFIAPISTSQDHLPLSPQDRDRCLLARERLISKQFSQTFGWLNPGDYSFNCTDIQRCNDTKRTIFWHLATHPLCSALKHWGNQWENGLCQPCILTCRDEHNSGRAEIWENLPSYFSLPPWDQLLETDGIVFHVITLYHALLSLPHLLDATSTVDGDELLLPSLSAVRQTLFM